jgi:hypothetical protein
MRMLVDDLPHDVGAVRRRRSGTASFWEFRDRNRLRTHRLQLVATAGGEWHVIGNNGGYISPFPLAGRRPCGSRSLRGRKFKPCPEPTRRRPEAVQPSSRSQKEGYVARSRRSEFGDAIVIYSAYNPTGVHTEHAVNYTP